MNKVTPQQIDELLPQTQCGLCGYGGCLPYAEAISYEQAAINLCPPGGVTTLRALANLLKQDPNPYLAEMEKKAKSAFLAVIRESECIGCAKCIAACPVDAILGSAKQMHTIIASECTGCELCVPPCPVDCIDLIPIPENVSVSQPEKAAKYRERFNARQKRLAHENEIKKKAKSQASCLEKKNYIQEAVLRAKAKKLTKSKT